MSYEIRRAGTGDEDLHTLAGFLATVFGRQDLYVPEYLRWLYVENPAGVVLGMNAWQGDALAGHYAVVPIKASSDSGIHRAALSLNTATHPDHKGRGLFTRLAERTFALAKDDGVSEIIGIANSSSMPGFVSRLGFTACGPLEARLVWGVPRHAPDPARPSWQREWEPESLRWRVRNPRSRYRVETRSGWRSILAATGWPGIQALLRVEIASGAVDLPDLPRAARAPIRLWLGRRADAAAVGGVSIPKRLRPSPLEVIHRSLDERMSPPDPDRLHFEALDFDAY
jgi:GNAT superfamily N-acetyltransferase